MLAVSGGGGISRRAGPCSATAGALNLATEKPSRERAARVVLGLGDRESPKAEGVLGGALSEHAFARLSLRSTYQGESFYTERSTGEDLGDAHTYAGRCQLAWTRPGRELPRWNANLKLHYARDDSTTAPFVHFGTLDPITFDTCAAILAGRIDMNGCVDALGFRDGDGDPFTGESNVAPTLDDEQLGATLTVSGVAGDLTWTRAIFASLAVPLDPAKSAEVDRKTPAALPPAIGPTADAGEEPAGE